MESKDNTSNNRFTITTFKPDLSDATKKLVQNTDFTIPPFIIVLEKINFIVRSSCTHAYFSQSK